MKEASLFLAVSFIATVAYTMPSSAATNVKKSAQQDKGTVLLQCSTSVTMTATRGGQEVKMGPDTRSENHAVDFAKGTVDDKPAEITATEIVQNNSGGADISTLKISRIDGSLIAFHFMRNDETGESLAFQTTGKCERASQQF